MPRKTPTLRVDDIADALEGAMSLTNDLLAAMLECLSCVECQGTGTRPTRDPKVTTRCDCRLSAEELLAEIADGEGPGDDDEDSDGDDDEDIEGI